MKGAPQPMYRMTLTTVEGRELDTCLGSLRYVSEYLGEHVYTRIEGYFDNYHKLRRELLRANGAYSCYYPTGKESTDRPVLLTILLEQYVPAPGYESDESIALRNMPLLPSTQRVIEQQNKLARENAARREPLSFTPINAAPTPAGHVDCTNCGIPVELVDGRGHCPYCVDMFDNTPAVVLEPAHSHPTLRWGQMSNWQRKQYAIKP